MISRYQRHGPTLVELGYDITPVTGKAPILEGWSKRPDAARNYTSFAAHSIGVLLGGQHNLVAVDVDVLNPFAANDIQQLIEQTLGFAPRRIGKAPKFLQLFRCTELRSKSRTGVYEIDGDDAGVELLGEGQQFVASGIHVDTKQKYNWPDDNIMDLSPTELIQVTPDQLDSFLAQAASVLATYGQLKGRVSNRTPTPRGGLNLKELDGEVREIETALTYLPNADEHYDDWINTLHAIKGALGENGRDLAHRWSQRSTKYEAQETDRAWDSIASVKHIGAGSIYHWARDYGFDLKQTRKPSRADAPAAVAAAENRERNAYNIMSLNELSQMPPPVPLVDGLLFKNTLVNLFGPPATFKSFVALGIGLSIAHQATWQGRKTEPGAVLYIAGEGASGIRKRANAWRTRYEIVDNGEPFFVLPQAINMRSVEEIDAIVEAANAKLKAPPVMVVIDTLARSFGGGEENSGQDMMDFVAGCDRMRDAFKGCAILVVHHAGKDTTKGARGHSSLYGAVDTEFEVKRVQGTDVVTLTNTKQKDSEEAAVIQLKAISVVLPGQGPLHLEDETSLVLEASTDAVPIREQQPRGKHSRVIYQTLKELMGELGEERYVGNQMTLRCITEDQLKTYSYMKMSVDNRHKHTRFEGAVAALQADNLVQFYNGFFWI